MNRKSQRRRLNQSGNYKISWVNMNNIVLSPQQVVDKYVRPVGSDTPPVKEEIVYDFVRSAEHMSRNEMHMAVGELDELTRGALLQVLEEYHND